MPTADVTKGVTGCDDNGCAGAHCLGLAASQRCTCRLLLPTGLAPLLRCKQKGSGRLLTCCANTAPLQVVSDMISAVEGFGLSDAWQWKPLMDGKQMMQVSDCDTACV